MEKSRPDPLARQADRQATCPSHGDFMASHIIGARWGSCPACATESAKQHQQDTLRRKLEVESAQREEALQARIRDSGLIGRFRDATFDTFVIDSEAKKKAATTCRDFAETVRRETGGLWLIGPPGTGKTHLGSAVVNHVIRERAGRAAIFSAREMIRMLRSTWSVREGRRWPSDAPKTEDEMIQHLGCDLSLLVLDEVGVTFGSDSEQVQLFDVLDLRYRNELPTVVLSNLPAGELKPVLGDRVYDRLRERARIVPMNWPSHRGSRA